MIKFWAIIYWTTGWYSPWARAAEYRYIKRHYREFTDYEEYRSALVSDVGLSLEVGVWQAKHGFTRAHKQSWRGK